MHRWGEGFRGLWRSCGGLCCLGCGFFGETTCFHALGNVGAQFVWAHQAKGVFELPDGLVSKTSLRRGTEFGADVGAFGPGPEFLLLSFVGEGLFEGEPLLVEVEALGEELGAAEAGDVGTELAEAEPADVGTAFAGDEGAGGGGIV